MIVLKVVVSLLLANNAMAVLSQVRWNTESVTVKQGDAINLTCTVSDLEFIDVIRVSFKNSEGQIMIVADNMDIKLPFSNIPRYGIDFYMKNQWAYITVLYQEIRGEDSGSLFCQKLMDRNSSAEVEIHVQVPVKDIFLQLNTPWTGKVKMAPTDHTIILREMQDNDLECVAVTDGGLTPAELRITIGNEDRTEFFTASEESRVIRNDTSDLGQYYSEYKLSYSTMVPLRDFNGRLLTCTAEQEGFSNVSTSALLTVEYGPVLICNKYDHRSRIGASVSILCEVAANPMSRSVLWSMDVSDPSASSVPSMPVKRQSQPLAADDNIILSETVINSDHKQVELTIKSVQRMHFTTYHLEAENSISSAEVTVVLLPASMQELSDEMMMMHLVGQESPGGLDKMFSRSSAVRRSPPRMRTVLLLLLLGVLTTSVTIRIQNG